MPGSSQDSRHIEKREDPGNEVGYLHVFDMCIIIMYIFDITYPKWIFGVYQESIKKYTKSVF